MSKGMLLLLSHTYRYIESKHCLLSCALSPSLSLSLQRNFPHSMSCGVVAILYVHILSTYRRYIWYSTQHADGVVSSILASRFPIVPALLFSSKFAARCVCIYIYAAAAMPGMMRSLANQLDQFVEWSGASNIASRARIHMYYLMRCVVDVALTVHQYTNIIDKRKTNWVHRYFRTLALFYSL